MQKAKGMSYRRIANENARTRFDSLYLKSKQQYLQDLWKPAPLMLMTSSARDVEMRSPRYGGREGIPQSLK